MGGKWGNNCWYATGKGRTQKGGRGRRASSSQNAYEYVYEESTEHRHACNIEAHLSKAHLRNYIGESSPFYLHGAHHEEEFFAPRAVARTRTSTNCEALNRLGYFPSFVPANSEAGGDVLLGLFKDDKNEDLKVAGIPVFVEAFSNDDGEIF